MATGPVTTARWERRPDSYVLHFTYDPSRSAARQQAARPAAAVDTPSPAANSEAFGSRQDRGSFFIGNTIERLRGLDPAFCGRTLSLVDGRRVSDRQSAQPSQPPQADSAPAPITVNQPYPPRVRYGNVEVWLLKADGTQILPPTYSCDIGTRPATGPAPVEITYEFPLEGGQQAVAAAIRVESNYYIEKLQRPVPALQ